MIGLGKWSLDVAVPMLKVQPILEIFEQDGQYAFTIDVGGFGASPAINLLECTEEGNTLKIKHNIPMMNTGPLDAVLSFDGNYCKGTVEIPMLGKISVQGVKVGI